MSVVATTLPNPSAPLSQESVRCPFFFFFAAHTVLTPCRGGFFSYAPRGRLSRPGLLPFFFSGFVACFLFSSPFQLARLKSGTSCELVGRESPLWLGCDNISLSSDVDGLEDAWPPNPSPIAPDRYLFLSLVCYISRYESYFLPFFHSKRFDVANDQPFPFQPLSRPSPKRLTCRPTPFFFVCSSPPCSLSFSSMDRSSTRRILQFCRSRPPSPRRDDAQPLRA